MKSIPARGALVLCCLLAVLACAQSGERAFRQLEEELPTPNSWRTASGAPGPGYWQQRADYEIEVELDEETHRITGSETITYRNNSPDALSYLWVQLDANRHSHHSDATRTATAPNLHGISLDALERLLHRESYDTGLTITRVADGEGENLPHSIVRTMMRVDLRQPLEPGGTTRLRIDWHYTLIDATLVSARSGYEHFEEDGNRIYEVAQWFPRMASYTDDRGWHHKQFIGHGEFTLEFGDYRVRITVPEDHIVAATGVLQNPDEVMSREQRERLEEAQGAADPVFIVTPGEARENQADVARGRRSWVFHAEKVRDFAFASSRKFIWDAMGYDINGNRGLAMSFYPNEGEPLWSRYSTRTIVHTLDVYSRHTFDYPYPVSISVNGPVYGMEYPMICFNGPRPEKDGTYSRNTKYSLITVIMHEIGHNFFPMIVNSDERQWTWMDEGLNTFMQFLAEQEWEEKYPSGRGEPHRITGYMTSGNQVPIMSNSESILQFGNNAYGKPATAINVLRETVLGRDLFDFAFREYSRRWMFKRPQPADFFRTMEDASGVDLDWFWRGWFYSTDHVDQSITDLRRFRMDTLDPVVDRARTRREREEAPESITRIRNRDAMRLIESHPELADFYNSHDDLEVTDRDREAYRKLIDRLEPAHRDILKSEAFFYVLEVENAGGVVMPVIVRIRYEDGSSEIREFPAEIWRRDSKRISKLLILNREVESVELDPHLQIADADRENNHFPRRIEKERFRPRSPGGPGSNPMRKAAGEKRSED